MPTNLATLYALQNKTNPKREQAKMMAEGIKTIEPDKYGYSSLAKIPLMYMYGQAAGEAAGIDEQNKEEMSGYLKSGMENEALKVKNEALKTGSEIAKNTSTIDKNRVEIGGKLLEGALKLKGDSRLAALNNPQLKAAMGIPEEVAVTASEDKGDFTTFDSTNYKTGIVKKWLLNKGDGKISVAGSTNGEGNEWMPIEGTTKPDVISPEAEAQKIRIGKAGKADKTGEESVNQQKAVVWKQYLEKGESSLTPQQANLIQIRDADMRSAADVVKLDPKMYGKSAQEVAEKINGIASQLKQQRINRETTSKGDGTAFDVAEAYKKGGTAKGGFNPYNTSSVVAPQPAASKYQEGDKAKLPSGKTATYRNGQWVAD